MRSANCWFETNKRQMTDFGKEAKNVPFGCGPKLNEEKVPVEKVPVGIKSNNNNNLRLLQLRHTAQLT